MAYEINYNDERFQKVEAEKNAALNDIDVTYGKMIGNSDKYYQQQIDATDQWGETQSQLQQEKTDFTIEKIEQQKEQAHKDYLKEQSGAYVDWQKQSDQYGVNAEKMASQGMQKTGYSESSQVSMYNTYQYRVTAAREVYSRAVLEYDNAIKDAQLQNSSILAEIAFETLQKKLQLGLEGFQYKNQLILDQVDKKLQVDEMYHGRWQDVLAQINTENALAEEVRQYNESLAEEKRQHNENMALQKQKLAEEQRQFNATMAAKNTGGNGGTVLGDNTSKVREYSKNEVSPSASKKDGQLKNIASISTYDAAVRFMKANGISNNGVPLLDSRTWNKAKSIGEHGSEFAYSSYADYVKNYLIWCVQQ